MTDTEHPNARRGMDSDLIARLRGLDCVMVEVCEPHPGNPSPNIIPIAREQLIAALEALRLPSGSNTVGKYIDSKADWARKMATQNATERDYYNHMARAFDALADEIRIGLHER